MNKINPNYFKEGKECWMYDSRAEFDVCYAHILYVLPHPENHNDRLIVYRWFGKNKKWWWYGVTSISDQELEMDYVTKTVERHNL